VQSFPISNGKTANPFEENQGPVIDPNYQTEQKLKGEWTQIVIHPRDIQLKNEQGLVTLQKWPF
jgi:hypothetical protein